ncbi:hypothetical protein M404DRAFT_1004083 [Pisolithus tinctorius Marx 270]|uniref:Uncharacterized protein n=1 Tax=Pisolithus tinctorius Marx 270 TaxID=870435 RepID=A0A0C3NYD1_PISTI|nr:hypothetical protein M404DRAFT_1004083 [Pisolithus tinctorius Marx 270]
MIEAGTWVNDMRPFMVSSSCLACGRQQRRVGQVALAEGVRPTALRWSNNEDSIAE